MTVKSARPYPLTGPLDGAVRGSVIDFPALEEKVLAYWQEHNTFHESLRRRENSPEFVFYDGPPFANGLPHYGHLITGYVKDIIPRYQTMRGYLVNRRFGWDTHGLPAELEAQRQLNISDISQIEKMGIATFNEHCKNSVLAYTQEWKNYVTRQARWVDFDNDYKTLDFSFMESIMWAFKTLYDKGLIYEGYKVLPYSWSEQTPLSNQEARLDDATRPRQDPALTVALPITGDHALAGASLLIWTTTPWTLPANEAVAVHPDYDYAVVLARGKRFIIAQDLIPSYLQEFGEDYQVESVVKGRELAGLTYAPPFDYFLGHPGAHRVLLADYVTLDSGTGLVHLAPAFGEEDFEVCTAHHIDLIIPVDIFGNFTDAVPDYAGLNIFAANPKIIKDLKNAGKIVRHETIEHAYPHSWRSGEPLIYMAVPSWFVKVSALKERMLELNKTINWLPEHLRDGQFGKWLEGAKDWNISRNRYWGSPIPVWVSDDPNYPRIDVYGSVAELERDFGVRPDNLHRPYIDALTRPNPDDPTGKSVMRRVPEVLDCWFESGSMPFASVHYPFENQEWFPAHFPGDFIVEYHGQTRAWFYNLLVMSTALFDSAPFKTAATHGIVLGSDGQKMSKSKRNYPDVNQVFDTLGSDTMRWYLTSSTLMRGGNFSVTDEGLRETVRLAVLPLWQVYSFFTLYSEELAHRDVHSDDVLDRYILAKLALSRDAITEALDRVDISAANTIVRSFIETLSNWYIRRSRPRFWAGNTQYPEAFNTLYTVLEALVRLAAPLLPLTTEALWIGLTAGDSVHLQDWPDLADIPRDLELVSVMDVVQDVCTAAVSIRKSHNIRVRLPLQELIIAGADVHRLEPYLPLIADEVNVKHVTLSTDVATYGRTEFTVNAKVAGPRLGGVVQQVIKAVKSGQWTKQGDNLVAAGVELFPGEYSEKLIATNPEATAELPHGQGLVILDLTVTPELEAEGWVKDRIRELQDIRKNQKLDVSDRITVRLWVPEGQLSVAQNYQDYLAQELLATSIHIASLTDDYPADAVELKDESRVIVLPADKK